MNPVGVLCGPHGDIKRDYPNVYIESKCYAWIKVNIWFLNQFVVAYTPFRRHRNAVMYI